VSPVGVSNTTTSQLPLNAYQLIGNGSDTDGTIEGFEWAIINQPNGASAFFQNDNNAIANPVVEGLSIVGDYTLQLTVIDDDGAFGMDTMMITVNPQANQAPKINSIGPMIDDSNKFMGNMPGAINTFGHSEFWKFDVSATDLEGNDINVAVTLMDSNQNPVFTDNTKIIVGGNGIATYTLPTLNVGNQLSPQSYELQIIVDDGSGNSTDQTFKIDLFNSSNNNIGNGGLLLQKGVSPKTKNGCFTNYQSTFTVPKGQTGSLVINEIDGTISSQSGTPLNNIGPGVYTWSVSLNNSAQVGVETTVEVVSSLSGGENGILTLKRQASDNANYDGSICQLSQS